MQRVPRLRPRRRQPVTYSAQQLVRSASGQEQTNNGPIQRRSVSQGDVVAAPPVQAEKEGAMDQWSALVGFHSFAGAATLLREDGSDTTLLLGDLYLSLEPRHTWYGKQRETEQSLGPAERFTAGAIAHRGQHSQHSSTACIRAPLLLQALLTKQFTDPLETGVAQHQ